MKTKPKIRKRVPRIIEEQANGNVVQDWSEVFKRRGKMANELLASQNEATQEVILRIRDRLRLSATGVMQEGGKIYKMEQQWIDHNLLFMACEIMSDLYMMGKQVENFVPDPAYCHECKDELFKVPKPPKPKRTRK